MTENKKPQVSQFVPKSDLIRLDPEQFKSLQRTLLRGAVVQGLLACGRLPLSTAKLEELKTIIETVEAVAL